jgi:hypothetical protein
MSPKRGVKMENEKICTMVDNFYDLVRFARGRLREGHDVTSDDDPKRRTIGFCDHTTQERFGIFLTRVCYPPYTRRFPEGGGPEIWRGTVSSTGVAATVCETNGDQVLSGDLPEYAKVPADPGPDQAGWYDADWKAVGFEDVELIKYLLKTGDGRAILFGDPTLEERQHQILAELVSKGYG